MTIGDLVQEVWEHIGEPGDLNPMASNGTDVDSNSNGYERIVKALREAQYRVLSWKNPQSERRFRWSGNFANNWKSTTRVDAGSITSSSTTVLTADNFSGNTPDAYAGYWAYQGTSEELRLIVKNTATAISVAEPFTADGNSETLYLYPPYFEMDTYRPILRVVYLNEDRELVRVNPEDVPLVESPSFSTPQYFWQIGKKVYYNPIADATTMYFFAASTDMPSLSSTSTDEPDVPPEFHEAVKVGAIAWGLGRRLEYQLRDAYRKEFYQLMQSITFPDDSEMDQQNDRFSVRTE